MSCQVGRLAKERKRYQMIACVFAGQGSQQVGMGRQLAADSAAARAVFDEAGAIAGLDLLALDENLLGQTRYAQLAIVSHSLAAFAAAKAEGLLNGPLAFAGFSLGEYSALAAAGVLSTSDVLRLVEVRASLMQQASESTSGAMYAILGLADETVEALLSEAAFAGKVFPVNYNCPGQLVIAGEAESTAAAADLLKAAGAKRALKLNVSGAFHTRLMSSAAPGLKAFAASLSFACPQGLLFSNRTGQILPETLDWPEYLADHLCNAVRWTSEVQAMDQAGASAFVEFGPGKTLSGLIRKISSTPTANVEDTASLAAAASLLRG
jgi:[acyl-carrier-protein] S-malonyltransferase